MRQAAGLRVRVAEVTDIDSLTRRFRLVSADGGRLPAFSAGSHTVVTIDDRGTRRMNAYSLASDPLDTTAYAICVRRDDTGRGGSLAMHRTVRPGHLLTLTMPVNLFPIHQRARRHLLIAGGIGVTPFIAYLAQLARANADFELHHVVRSAALARNLLPAPHMERIHVYRSDLGERIDLPRRLAEQPIGTHLYVCGPEGMITATLDAARDAGWPEGALHHERFQSSSIGGAFRVELHNSGRIVDVAENQSLLDALEAAGIDVPWSCRGGACGRCETAVIRADGEILHRDHWLTPGQRAAGNTIMPCVSRFAGASLVIDR